MFGWYARLVDCGCLDLLCVVVLLCCFDLICYFACGLCLIWIGFALGIVGLRFNL